jgi:hypothetical protein
MCLDTLQHNRQPDTGTGHVAALLPALRPWKNASKILARSSSGIPGPVSAKSITKLVGSRRARIVTMPPLGVNFTAFDNKLSNNFEAQLDAGGL